MAETSVLQTTAQTRSSLELSTVVLGILIFLFPGEGDRLIRWRGRVLIGRSSRRALITVARPGDLAPASTTGRVTWPARSVVHTYFVVILSAILVLVRKTT